MREGEGDRNEEKDRERDRKDNFHQKELAIQTSEMNAPWSQIHRRKSVVDR